jgi:hypothetical protein
MTTTIILETAAPTRAGSDVDEPVGVITGTPRTWLRLEGLTLVIGALAGFATTGKTWWLVPALLLLPDVAALGYLWNTRVGAHLYNLSHAAPVPVALAGIGIWQHESLVLAIALIWLAHIGMDRAMNYGLKYPDDSRHTHLGRHGH